MLAVDRDVPLAPMTTFELGGPARLFARATSSDEVVEAIELARTRELPLLVLGGGSNVVIADAGVDGLVLQIDLRGVTTNVEGDRGRVFVASGESWDPFVSRMVAAGLAGIECLAGIPGRVGATPIQNVGAYGQEISDVLTAVHVVDRRTGERAKLHPADCGFAYRDSVFKRNPDRWIVLGVELGLVAGGPPTVRYQELRDAVGSTPTLFEVRDTVLGLRRRKSMVIDRDDPNRRSAGSFFTNPIVSSADAERIVAEAIERGLARAPADVPRYETGSGEVKLAAGWLIERAGISKGMRRGPVGVSSRHALALVHHGGGSTKALLDLARHVRDTVEQCFGVRLVPEPVLVGESW